MQFSFLSVLFLFSTSSYAAEQPARVKRNPYAVASSSSSAPSPTQSGVACNCNSWYKVVSGDTCSGIVAKYNNAFTLQQFYAWNPAVGSNCQSLWLDTYMCVGVSSTTPASCISSTSTSTATKSTSVTSTKISSSSPTTSTKISSSSPTSFSTKSSSLSSSSTPTSSASYSVIQPSTTYMVSSVPSSSSTAFPPSPTQSGLAAKCNQFYKVKPGDSCDGIRAQYQTWVSLDQFYQWNPAVGNCTALWVNYWVCVGVPQDLSYLNSTATSQYIVPWTSTTMVMNSTVAIPSPTNTGLVNGCQGFYQAQSGDTCNGIAAQYSYFSGSDFMSWNPAVGSNCASITISNYYCIATGVAYPPAPSYTSSVKPSPTQSGLISSCTSFYQCVGGEDCGVIAAMFGSFNETTFISWNPAVGTNCATLLTGQWYCVGVPGTPTTRTSFLYPTSSIPYGSVQTTSATTTA